MITSLRNPLIIEVRRLQRRRERRATGRTTIEGPFLLQEAIAAGVVVHEVFATPDDEVAAQLSGAAGVTICHVSSGVLKGMATSVNPRGPIAVVTAPQSSEIESVDSVVLWDIADPGNAGTMIRTAAAFGFQVLATADTVDLWSPKVVRAAVGGHFRTRISEGLTPTLDPLTRAGLATIVATADGTDVSEVDLGQTGPVGLIIGNEAHGIPAEIAEADDIVKVALPMPGGSESLNAAVSAGILMYLRVAKRDGR